MLVFYPTVPLHQLQVKSKHGSCTGYNLRVYNAHYDEGALRINYICCENGLWASDLISKTADLNDEISFNIHVKNFVESCFGKGKILDSKKTLY